MIPIEPIFNFISQNILDTEQIQNPIQKKWIIYLTKIYLSNALKLIEIYALATLLGTFITTFISHITFILLRRFSFGYHAKTSLGCSLQSMFFFCIVPLLTSRGPTLVKHSSLIFILCAILIILSTPYITKNSPLLDKSEKNEKKKAAALSLILIITIYLFTSKIIYQNAILSGLIAQAILLPPINENDDF